MACSWLIRLFDPETRKIPSVRVAVGWRFGISDEQQGNVVVTLSTCLSLSASCHTLRRQWEHIRKHKACRHYAETASPRKSGADAGNVQQVDCLNSRSDHGYSDARVTQALFGAHSKHAPVTRFPLG